MMCSTLQLSFTSLNTLSSRKALFSGLKRSTVKVLKIRSRLRAQDEQKNDVDEVYVGDGKVIVDDPRKYPSKEDAGLIQGATGGWAGGEPGLQKFMETIKSNEIHSKTPEKEKIERQIKKTGKGNDKIYVGFDYKNDEDMEARNRGEQGNFVIDDEKKYPNRDYAGWIPLQGGFAGGEVGLKKFLEEGDIEIRPSNVAGKSQKSPVVIGIFIAAVATTGGLLLTDVIDLSEGLLNLKVDQSPLDEKTKLLLEIAVGLLALTWAGGFVLASLKAIRERLNTSTAAAQRFMVSVGFWAVVLYLTYNLAKT